MSRPRYPAARNDANADTTSGKSWGLNATVMNITDLFKAISAKWGTANVVAGLRGPTEVASLGQRLSCTGLQAVAARTHIDEVWLADAHVILMDIQ